MTNFAIGKKLKNAQNSYLCRDNQTGVIYAAKIIQAQDQQQKQYIKEKLEQLKQLKSKYFVQIVTYFIEGLKITIIMDFIEGASLTFLTHILSNKIYTDYCKQLLIILTDIQNYKITFAQIDLSNIYLSKKGDLKLQLCKFNNKNENHKIATGKTIFKLLTQQDYQSMAQLESTEIEDKFKVLIKDLIMDKTMSDIVSRSQWVFMFGNEEQYNNVAIQRENIELDEQISKQIAKTQNNPQLLKVVINPSSIAEQNSSSSSDWGDDLSEQKQKIKPKGSTALLQKIKQGLFKHQNQDSSPSIGKQYSNKYISNKQMTEDIKTNTILLPIGNKQLVVNKKKIEDDDDKSDFSGQSDNQQQNENDEQYKQELESQNQLCQQAYNFSKQQSFQLAKDIMQKFVDMKDNFYQFYRQYLQPTLLLDLYTYCQSNVESWIYYIQSIIQISKNNWKIKSEILILGIQHMIYENMAQYFVPEQKEVLKIFFILSEYCQVMVKEGQEEELKILQLFLVNKGTQIVSSLLKTNKIFTTEKLMIDKFSQDGNYLNQIDNLIQLISYCDKKGYKYQVYRLCTEDDPNSIQTFIKFAFSIYEGQNVFSQKEKVLELLKKYLEFILKCASSTSSKILQKNSHVQLLAAFIQKSDHQTKILLLQLLNQIFNQPENVFLNDNSTILITLINEQLNIYLKAQQIPLEQALGNVENIFQLILIFIRNSLARAQLLFDKQIVEMLDKEYQKLLQANIEDNGKGKIMINILQINAEQILLQYIRISNNFESLSIEVKTDLVKLTLQQFVRQSKLQEPSIRAMYKLCHTYDFDRLRVDDIQQININQQYFMSQVVVLKDTQWNPAQLTTFQLQQLIVICEKCSYIRTYIFNASFLKAILHGMKENEQESGFLEKGLQLFKIYFQSRQYSVDSYEIRNLQTKIVSLSEILLQHKNQSVVKLCKEIISLQ